MSIAGAATRLIGPAVTQVAKPNRLAQLGKIFQEEALSSLLTAPFSAYYYGTQYDPATAAGMTIADLVGSAAVRGVTQGLVNKIRPPRYETVVNPKYTDLANQLGVKPGATHQDISDATLNKLRTIQGNRPASSITPDSAEYKQGRAVIDTANQLYSMGPKDQFLEQRIPSRLAAPLANVADISFSVAGMGELEKNLVNAGIITPNSMKEQNPGLVNQGSVVDQQLASRAFQGTPNNAILSPGTQSQMSSMEINRMMTALLEQAHQQRDQFSVGVSEVNPDETFEVG